MWASFVSWYGRLCLSSDFVLMEARELVLPWDCVNLEEFILEENLDLKNVSCSSQLRKGVEKRTGLAFGYKVF